MIFRVPAREQLLLHSDHGGRAYHYFWTFPGEDKKQGACHAIELSSVFNNLQETIYTGNNVNRNLAEEIQQMWVNFAKTGNPSTEQHQWPAYTRDKQITLMLGETIRVKENLFSRRTEIIEKLLKYHINGSYAELSFNVPYIKLLIATALGFIALIILLLVLILN